MGLTFPPCNYEDQLQKAERPACRPYRIVRRTEDHFEAKIVRGGRSAARSSCQANFEYSAG